MGKARRREDAQGAQFSRLLEKMVEYFPIEVIPKDLVNLFFDKDLKCSVYVKTSVYVTPTIWFYAGSTIATVWLGM